MKIIDPASKLFIADTNYTVFPDRGPDRAELMKARKDLIVSSSGWRKIFSADGDEESKNTSISPPDRLLVAKMGLAFGRFISTRSEHIHPLIAVGIDSRYTGPVIADIIIRTLLTLKIEIRYLFITPAPEIMAYVQTSAEIAGFVYVTASHNPIGHNGVKFGLDDGGVVGGTESSDLISSFEVLLTESDYRILMSEINNVPKPQLKSIYEAAPKWKKEAQKIYADFAMEVAAKSGNRQTQDILFRNLRHAGRKQRIGVIAELNGSARCLSIDREILELSGSAVLVANGKPRQIVHRIVPEGDSLFLCKSLLEEAYQKDNQFIMGYVPDNDGDRGNLVCIDRRDGKGYILQAQEVFALACMSELAYCIYQDQGDAPEPNTPEQPPQRLAVAVNGPTSMRIEQIAKSFGARVFRSEVGEANVVALARKLRGEGFTVNILGEGSNGGSIVHPAAVRDPINTVIAFIKLMLLRSTNGKAGLFDIWCRKSSRNECYSESFSIFDVLESLPIFTTTGAYEKRALMNVKTEDHGKLKKAYEKIFLTDWENTKVELSEKYDLVSWSAENYEGTESKAGLSNRDKNKTERGGLKILFQNPEGENKACIWMRGSGTEPVFRILADVEGKNPDLECFLLDWQREMIERADQSAIR